MIKQIILLYLLSTIISKPSKIPIVYFTKNITSQKIVELFEKLNITLTNNMSIKIDTGEIEKKNFLHPDFLQNIYDYTNGTFVECNDICKKNHTTTEEHKEILKINGWLDNNRKTVIMDEDQNDNYLLNITARNSIKKNIAGGHLNNFNNSIVISNFNKHYIGGFNGALIQLGLGFASIEGKKNIFTVGNISKWNENFCNINIYEQKDITTAMILAALSITRYFKQKKKETTIFINVLANFSIDYDEKNFQNIGILVSTDPVAIDQASINKIREINNLSEELLDQLDLFEENIINCAQNLASEWTKKYDFIEIDNDNNSGTDENIKIESTNLWVFYFLCIILFILVCSAICLVVSKIRKIKNDDLLAKINE